MHYSKLNHFPFANTLAARSSYLKSYFSRLIRFGQCNTGGSALADWVAAMPSIVGRSIDPTWNTQ
jgi:hypothetical protein